MKSINSSFFKGDWCGFKDCANPLNMRVNNCTNIMYASSQHTNHKPQSKLADFCLNHCPHEDCEEGTCKEFRAFARKYINKLKQEKEKKENGNQNENMARKS